jgi:pyridoxamine 5'-phosphate oxidase
MTMADPAGLQEPPSDPVELFERWQAEARAAAGPDRADAMALATATADGAPSVRVVMLRGVDSRGFVFHTNYESRKGRELSENPRAALVLNWPELHRQVSATGTVERLNREESKTYFRTRPLGHRLAAWASLQGRPLPDRAELERRFERARERFGEDPPLPEYWGGFRLAPDALEFWQGREDRLHDRVRYERSESGGWHAQRLFP